MRAKDPSLILKKSHDAMVKEVSGHVCIYCCKGIIKEVDFFILRRNKNAKELKTDSLTKKNERQSWASLALTDLLIYKFRAIEL